MSADEEGSSAGAPPSTRPRSRPAPETARAPSPRPAAEPETARDPSALPRPEPDTARVLASFDAVVDLPPDEMAAQLDALCAGDAALREAVTRLVAHDRKAAPGFLAPPAALPAEALREQAARAPASSRAPAAIPARLGRFAVLRKLGEGGMGAVYVAQDDVLDRRVALKLLHQGAEARAWLRREGQALARLAHPNVVAIHELGEHEGRVFLAMELVEGPTLRAYLAERKPPFAEVLRLLLEAGRGLAAAHAAGLVHRDFKPDNVLVGPDGRARVVDFGLAKLAELAAVSERRGASARDSALARPLTRTGAIVGTPAYMAPEQLRGERATAQSDQFSFSVTLYRAAYGAAPFPAADIIELSQRLAAGEPAKAPPRPDVPRWLEPILRRGLAGSPADRFPSLEAMLAAIERRLPRDPELDPIVVRRELQLLRVAVLLFGLGVLLFASEGLSRWLATPGKMVAQAAANVVFALVLLAARWRRLAANRFGRRAAGLFLGVMLALFGHRLVALGLGLPVGAMAVEDMVMLTVIFGVAAVTTARWAFGLAALAAVGVAGGLLWIERAPLVFGFVALAILASLTFDGFRRW